MKKHKFIDKFKSWLLTFGIASVFGLAALGCNAAQSYEKTSAYSYNDTTGVIDLDLTSNFDILLLRDFILTYGVVEEDVSYVLYGNYNFRFTFSDLTNNNTLEFRNVFTSFNTSDNSFTFGEFYSLSSSDELPDSILIVTLNQSDGLFYIDDVVGEDFLDYDYGDYTSSNFDISYLPSFNGYQNFRNYVLAYHVPQSDGNLLSALTDFMSILGSGIVELAQSLASGVTSMATALFIDNGSLSIFGGIIGIFAGIALAVGITTKVYTWVTSLGN